MLIKKLIAVTFSVLPVAAVHILITKSSMLYFCCETAVD